MDLLLWVGGAEGVAGSGCTKASSLSLREIIHVSGSLSTYVCQCVTEQECVLHEPYVSGSPSVSEKQWNAGDT